MNVTEEEILSIMDLLDIDEELIDARLSSIMSRTIFTDRHIINANYLFQYKKLMYIHEGDVCPNDEYFDFVVNLKKNHFRACNVDNICKMMYIVLTMDPDTIAEKVSHLLQQLLSDIIVNSTTCNTEDDTEDGQVENAIHNLKMCDTILDAVINNDLCVDMKFLEVDIEGIMSSHKRVKVHFMTKTAPKLDAGVEGYYIYDIIWSFLRELPSDKKYSALQDLCCLADIYLPVANGQRSMKYKSMIVFSLEFWNLLLSGLSSMDPFKRKKSIYLAKRAIDYVKTLESNVSVKTESSPLFQWNHKNSNGYKTMWTNFFTLLDSLEEKQTNIVLPSLHLFESLLDFGQCWLNCALNIGLTHEHLKVRAKCLEYRLKIPVECEKDARIFLEALNDINLYENSTECENLKSKIKTALLHNFILFYQTIPKIHWSPVPMYHLSNILVSVDLSEFPVDFNEGMFLKMTIDILSVPCNNSVLSTGIHINMVYFVFKCCNNFATAHLLVHKNVVKLFESLATKSSFTNNLSIYCNRLKLCMSNASQALRTDPCFLKHETMGYFTADYAISYLENFQQPTDMEEYIDILIAKVQDIKCELEKENAHINGCLEHIIYFILLYNRIANSDEQSKVVLKTYIMSECADILKCIVLLVYSKDPYYINLHIIDEMFPENNYFFKEIDNKYYSIFLDLYRACISLLKQKHASINKKVVSVSALYNVVDIVLSDDHLRDQIFSPKEFLKILKPHKISENIDNEIEVTFRNVYLEKCCKILNLLISRRDVHNDLDEIINFIQMMRFCGGFGCMKWVIKIMKNVLPYWLSRENSDSEILNHLSHLWLEILMLKSNSQFAPCMKEFIHLITCDELLNDSKYHPTIHNYCNEIVQGRSKKNTPIYFLIAQVNNKNNSTLNNLLCDVIANILMYSPVPSKEKRITENLIMEVFDNLIYKLQENDIHYYFSFQIYHQALLAVSKMEPSNVMNIVKLFTDKIDKMFKNKPLYHMKSSHHRELLKVLQHILCFVLLNPEGLNLRDIINWAVDLLGKLPHQPSARTYLEWCIALCLYMKKKIVKASTLYFWNGKKIPLMSQFMMMYWLVKHRAIVGKSVEKETTFVIETLLSHTMGQTFAVRLYAQYLSVNLFNITKTPPGGYEKMVEIMNKTLESNSDNKSVIMMKQNYFINDFDIIGDLMPGHIYYYLPLYCDVGRVQNIYIGCMNDVFTSIVDVVKEMEPDNLKTQWMLLGKTYSDIVKSFCFSNTEINDEAVESNDSFIVQKKYIPWTAMTDVEECENKEKKSCSELIVVASLVDKLPNLGGIARTCEVFGVKSYVISNKAHLKDANFKGLSLSAENWINIEEVKPGRTLVDYLMKMKDDGYTLVAAEQTSDGSELQNFRFPKKALLLLGHEKQGIPSDLLSLVDQCVEIPQHGFIRSLNVHVCAALFIWQYNRQYATCNILS